MIKKILQRAKSIIHVVKPNYYEATFPYTFQCRNGQEITVSPIPESRAAEAMYVLADIFTKQAPLCFPFKIPIELTHQRFIKALEYASNPMVSIYATDPYGKIVGVHLNDETLLDNSKNQGKKFIDTKLMDHYTLFDKCENMCIDHYKQKNFKGKILRFYSGGVADGMKGYGILSYMAWASLAVAKSHGYDEVIVEASNKGSQKTIKMLGFKEIARLKYNEYFVINEQGERTYPFAEVDALTTQKANRLNKFGKKWSSYAPDCMVMASSIDNALARAKANLF